MVIIRKPPMGWNTWNTFGPDINEQLIMESAKRMSVTDLWTGEELPLVNSTIPQKGMPAHSCQVYRIHIER